MSEDLSERTRTNEVNIQNLEKSLDRVLDKLEEMDKEMKSLNAHFHQSRGGLKVGMWIAGLVTTVAGVTIGAIRLFK